MKSYPFVSSRRRRAGFSMAELLVVMAILAILMTLTFSGISIANKKQRSTKTEAQMAVFKAGLEKFKSDHGGYPQITDAEEGSKLLYAALSGDTNYDGEYDKSDKNLDWLNNGKKSNRRAKSYVPELLAGGTSNQGWVDEDYYIIDAFGERIRYEADVNSRQMWNAPTHYDLWSLGTNNLEEEEENQDKWIKNW
ncbi:type II secretion system protein [Sulfuriroseicoccus oceanibius]|uniref:Type II secretion system protein n=1 Tax=Sulfuriroseicoccus oceanibius TaxID=2707525 RepID=A0A6B3L9N0_9BACT|nr:type II secretion system protein [Sulfuriroseicoccus oceanibius]QQL43989.1 type II secretion system protein [Sulfuriroseicoccus oceanibius]